MVILFFLVLALALALAAWPGLGCFPTTLVSAAQTHVRIHVTLLAMEPLAKRQEVCLASVSF